MQDMTTGPIRGHVLKMMAFMLTAMFMQTLYALVDIFWVGKLGKEAIAAVGIASNLMFVMLAISQTLSVASVAMVSQAFGRKDGAEVQRVFNQSQCQSAIVALLVLIAGMALRDTYTSHMASDATTAALASGFLNWFIPSQALLFLMTALGSALRGIGNMKPGLIAQMASILLNMVLAPFLIFGWLGLPKLGVPGAALATFIATVAAVAGLALYLARKSSYLRIDFALWRPDWKLWKRMFAIGLPSGAEFLMMSVILGLIYVVIRPFGAASQAGFGIGLRLMQAGFMPAVALSFAAAAVAGQNFGAQNFDRVRQTFVEGAKLNIAFMLAFTILCQLLGGWMVGLFSHEAGVVAVGADYLHFISFNYIASGLILVSAGMFQGIGNTLPSLMASGSRLLTFLLPVLWLAKQPGFTIHQVWWVSVTSVALQMCLSLLLLRREFARRLPLPGGDALASPAL